jgi:hypothetical protein
MSHVEAVNLQTENGRAAVAEYERENSAEGGRGQQLYAKIKRTSRYAYQNAQAKEEPQRWGGFPFKVYIDPSAGGYCVKGGPGGQYRLADVNLFIIEDGRELRIS